MLTNKQLYPYVNNDNYGNIYNILSKYIASEILNCKSNIEKLSLYQYIPYEIFYLYIGEKYFIKLYPTYVKDNLFYFFGFSLLDCFIYNNGEFISIIDSNKHPMLLTKMNNKNLKIISYDEYKHNYKI